MVSSPVTKASYQAFSNMFKNARQGRDDEKGKRAKVETHILLQVLSFGRHHDRRWRADQMLSLSLFHLLFRLVRHEKIDVR